LAQTKGWPSDTLDLQLPFGLKMQLPRGAFKEEL
jgi:hypothetical protein